MQRFFLLLCGVMLLTCLSAQTPGFLSTFTAERGSVLRPANDGKLWLGGMIDQHVLIVKLSSTGQLLERHGIDFKDAGLEGEYLTDFFETPDGRLVGCGNFETDNLGRSFVFSYDPAQKVTLWATVVQNAGFQNGITELAPGGDYLLYGNVPVPGGDDAQMVRIDRQTGLQVQNQVKRYHLGTSQNLLSIVAHNGALYGCGRFTNGSGFDGYNRMRNTLCKLDTASLTPVWTNLSPLPTAASARLYGRDLIIDEEHIISTFSGDPTGPDLFSSQIFLQKNDLDGHLLWVKQYDLPEWNGEFAEEVIALPDGYMLYGHEQLADDSRLFLLKTDKEGNPVKAVKIDFAANEDFPEIPARSKILRLGDALFLTAYSQDDLGQSQGLLVKTGLNGDLADSCGYLSPTPVQLIDVPSPVSETVTPVVTTPGISVILPTVERTTPDLTFSKQCGATGTCPTLSDVTLSLDSITCTNGEPRLHYTYCNVGGQNYEGAIFFGLYDKNPLTDSATLVETVIHQDNNLAPGECISSFLGSQPFSLHPYLLDTFPELYGLMGSNLAATPPIPLSSFPLSPNKPECTYLNNLDSIRVPLDLCSGCDHPSTFIEKLGSQQRTELGYSMCTAADGNIYLAGRQGANPMIAKVTRNGVPIWVRNFPGNANEPIELAEIIEDSDHKVLICGTQGSSPGTYRTIVLRYDPVADSVLWYKQSLANRPEASGILERGHGGNFLVRANSRILINNVLKTRTDLWELDRETGVKVPGGISLQYKGTPNLRFENMVQFQNELYGVGSWELNNGPQPLFTKVSALDGQPISAQVITADTTAATPVRFAYTDIIQDFGLAMITGVGLKDPNDPLQGSYAYLEKHAPDGSLAWLKRYDFSISPTDVVALPDAYVLFGPIVPGANQWGILKVDKFGNVLVAKRLNVAPPAFVSTSYANRKQRLLFLGEHLMMLDHEQQTVTNDILLFKTNLNLEIGGTCDRLQDVSVQATTLPAQSTPVTLPVAAFNSDVFDAGVTLQPDVLAVSPVCPDCAGSCTDKPDMALTFLGLQCVNGFKTPRFEVCNVGTDTFVGSLQVTIYAGNPLHSSAPLCIGSGGPAVLPPDSCQIVTFSFSSPVLCNSVSGPLYAIFTSGESALYYTPFSLDTLGLINGAVDECTYTNNVDSFYYTVPPMLGDDRSICEGQTITLDPGSGFAAYHWFDGAQGQTHEISEPGLYTVEVQDSCGVTLRDSVLITLSPSPQLAQTLTLLPGDSVVIGGVAYTAPATVVETIPSLSGGCDTVLTYTLLLDVPCMDVTLTKTIQFYPGDTIVIDGTVYTQSDTVVQTFATAAGCDSIVTNVLQLIVTQVDIQCPADLTVTLPPNTTGTVVDYNLPTATTDCPDPDLHFTLLGGLPIGGVFPEGATQVCYEAANACGIRDTCCFTITGLLPDLPCDSKSVGCLRYELLSIRLDSSGQRRYRIRMVNDCITPVQYAYIQLPNGVTAVAPADGSVYAAPGGNTYTVRNPNASPFYSIRYKQTTGVLNNGKNDVFEYTLPQQAAPAYIHVAVKLNDGNYTEVFLNTFDCPVQPYSGQRPAKRSLLSPALDVHPNPTDGMLYVHLAPWRGQRMDLQVLNAQGQLVLDRAFEVDTDEIGLDLPASLASGLYYLSVQPAGGEKTALRFVLQR